MCNEAEELFEEYYAAVEAPALPGDRKAERRIRRAKKMLTSHNADHHCCLVFRFEISTASDNVWRFRSAGCHQGSH